MIRGITAMLLGKRSALQACPWDFAEQYVHLRLFPDLEDVKSLSGRLMQL